MKVSVKRTYLELPDRASFVAPVRREPEGACVEHISPCTVETYRALYRVIGERWHWRDKLVVPDESIESHLQDPGVRVFGLRVPGIGNDEISGYAGYFELIRREPGVVEIFYFGLIEDAIGRGLGGFLLMRAVEEASAMGAERVILNTCTLDSPHALPNYKARGFRELREEWYETEIPDTIGKASS